MARFKKLEVGKIKVCDIYKNSFRFYFQKSSMDTRTCYWIEIPFIGVFITIKK